jgi:hypothetical protein
MTELPNIPAPETPDDVSPLAPEIRAALAAAGRIGGHNAYLSKVHAKLVEVDTATPGLPAEERQARARALFVADMQRYRAMRGNSVSRH